MIVIIYEKRNMEVSIDQNQNLLRGFHLNIFEFEEVCMHFVSFEGLQICCTKIRIAALLRWETLLKQHCVA